MKKMQGRLALIVGVTLTSPALAAMDNFDSYANGSDLIGQGNGELSYVLANPIGNVITGTNLQASNLDSQSSPQSMRFRDPTSSAEGFTVQVAPTFATDLTASGATTNLSFDFKALDGYGSPNGRPTIQMVPLYSVDAAAGAQDWLDLRHWFVLSDSGLSYVDATSVLLGDTGPRWENGTWYHLDLKVENLDGAGTFRHTLTLTRASDNALINTVATGSSGAPDLSNGGRTWLTGLVINGSGNTNEDILIDNLRIGGAIPEPASLGLLAMSGLAVLRRRK